MPSQQCVQEQIPELNLLAAQAPGGIRMVTEEAVGDDMVIDQKMVSDGDEMDIDKPVSFPRQESDDAELLLSDEVLHARRIRFNKQLKGPAMSQAEKTSFLDVVGTSLHGSRQNRAVKRKVGPDQPRHTSKVGNGQHDSLHAQRSHV